MPILQDLLDSDLTLERVSLRMSLKDYPERSATNDFAGRESQRYVFA